MPPLDGYHVLDLSLLLPGPLATQILRDLGARVTKIEPPAPGDYMAHWPPMVGPVSATYLAVNRGKTIISLDLKTDAGRARMLELAAEADVVLDGFRPGVLDRLGVGYAELSRRNPKIVVCSISGYGQSGPYADRAGHDLNYQALAGVLSLAGGEGSSPSNPPLQVADTAAGSYAAVMLILAALLERDRTGRGRHIDISMSEQLLPMMTTIIAATQAEGRDARRDDELLTGGATCYRIFRTADGQFLSVGSLEPKFWWALVERLGVPEFAGADLSGPSGRELAERLSKIFATRSRAEWEAEFADVDACFEPVLSLDEVRKHPHWVARESFVDLPTPDGRTLQVPKMPGALAGFESGENPR
jgi:crotonobetainyl-CoA:carnitine CoA-transferase CaiB-like acyl-CoA transferase